MNVFDYYTPEQQEMLKKRMEAFSTEEIKRLRKESNKIIEVLRAEMEKGTPIENSKIVQLSKRLKEMTDQFTGSDPEIDKATERFYENHLDYEMHGMDMKLYKYYRKSAGLKL